MQLAFSALAALVLLLLALRLTQRLTLRFKVLAGVSVSRQPQKACPHLGSSTDPFNHTQQPSDDHRCYLWMQRDRIDLVHQKGFCLTTAHHRCPWLMIRRPDAPPPLRQRLPRLAAGAPRAAWGGLRAVPGLAAAAFRRAPREVAAPTAPLPPRWERPGEGPSTPAKAPRPKRLAPAFASVSDSLGRRAQSLGAAAGRGASALGDVSGRGARAGAGRLGAGLLVAGAWTAHALLRLAALAVRGLGWLLPRVARALAWLLPRLGRGLAWLALRLGRGLAWATMRLGSALAGSARRGSQALAERRAAAPAQPAVPGLEPVLAAAVAESEEAPPPPSLARLEELLAEGLATLDRGQESLAYHIFAKATQQRAPRGAGEAYADALKRAWFWRAKTAETVAEVVSSLEHALEYEPGNLQMQAHLAWARQRLERESKLLPIDAATPAPKANPRPATPSRTWTVLGSAVRLAGGLMALVLAALWMTTAVMPALGHVLSQMPAGDELLLRRLILTVNATALPGQGRLPLPLLNYDLGLSLPFVMAFAFVFTARGLMDGDSWARTTGLFFAGIGGWLCAAAVDNPDASRLGLALCVGIIVAAVAGHFNAPKSPYREMAGW